MIPDVGISRPANIMSMMHLAAKPTLVSFPPICTSDWLARRTSQLRGALPPQHALLDQGEPDIEQVAHKPDHLRSQDPRPRSEQVHTHDHKEVWQDRWQDHVLHDLTAAGA